MIRALVIPVRGLVRVLELEDQQAVYKATIEEVGPDICAVPFRVAHTDVNAYVGTYTTEADGRARLPWNARASLLNGDHIAGPMIVFGQVDAEGKETSVPQHIIEYAKSLRDF